MLTLDKSPVAAAPAPAWSSDAPLSRLLDALADHANKALVFVYDGREVLPGYHVTEVKSGRFDALDCGANPESWRETFIQLWDVPAEAGRTFMPVWKFLAIMKKVADAVPFDAGAKLTFEVSDPSSAMRLFGVDAVEIEGDTVRVSLTRRPASCKPRDRWLEQAPKANARASANENKSCCN